MRVDEARDRVVPDTVFAKPLTVSNIPSMIAEEDPSSVTAWPAIVNISLGLGRASGAGVGKA